jgi:pimeloyl-ACP methyl ester carboxylesterase
MTTIDRGFAKLAEGQVHYRQAGARGGVPLLMIHASPASSVLLQPLMAELAQSRRVIAPDTPGNGDSAPMRQPQPELVDYADALVRVMDALHLDTVDLYGTHTGAHIAIEVAIARADRIRRVVLDGVGMWVGDERRDLLENYAPAIEPDAYGSQMFWATQFVRDQAWFFPHYRKDSAHNRRLGALSPSALHTITVEVLKAVATYHLAYRAVFRNAPHERLPLIRAPTLVMADRDDPLAPHTEAAAALLADGRARIVAGGASAAGLRDKAEVIRQFLDAHQDRPAAP